jgi:leader peptidase (prepilin peptidase) / N-methyltransferase
MIIVFYILVFLFGLIIGSFLNVCIYRLSKGESILSSPFRFPLIELLTAIIFISLFWRYGLSINFIASIFLISVLIAVFFIDIDSLIIPDELVITGLAGGVLLILYILLTSKPVFEESSWLGHLMGILPGSGLLFLVALIGLLIYKSDEVIGMGDVKIFLPIGLFLGLKLCIFAMMSSVIFAGLFSIVLIVTGLKKRRDTIPFGPFIVTGTFIALLCGNQVVQWYLSIY